MFLQTKVRLEQGLTLLTEDTDIFGKIRDQSLQPLELGDALAVFSNQPFGARWQFIWRAMFGLILVLVALPASVNKVKSPMTDKIERITIRPRRIVVTTSFCNHSTLFEVIMFNVVRVFWFQRDLRVFGRRRRGRLCRIGRRCGRGLTITLTKCDSDTQSEKEKRPHPNC